MILQLSLSWANSVISGLWTGSRVYVMLPSVELVHVNILYARNKHHDTEKTDCLQVK
jgi:hypothetical protein